jgi:hypothetical protein
MTPSIAIQRRLALTVFWSAIAVAGVAKGYAQQPAPGDGMAPPPAVATTQSEVQAREILQRMARFLAGTPSFSVNLATSYDAVQKSGEKIEFGERRKVTLSRPDRLRVESERSDGSRMATVFTGKEIVLTDFTNKIYVKESQTEAIDESIVYFVGGLGMRLPLAVLLMSRLPSEFEKRVRTIDYVEKTNLFGMPSHHLAGRTDTVDFQVWVGDGEKPVPLRVVLNYVNEPGEPQFRAQLTDWNLAPALDEATFVPRIPDGAQQIAFAARLAGASPATRQASPNKGGRQ